MPNWGPLFGDLFYFDGPTLSNQSTDGHNQPFAGTTAVVTGASSGIGRATAMELAAWGVCKMVVHYRTNLDGANETAQAVREFGCESVVLSADLSDLGQCEQLVDGAFDSIGPIQTWINNAGADVLTGEAADMGFQEKLRRLFDVDVIGTIGLSRIVADRLLAQNNDRPPSMTFIGWDQAPHGMEGDAGQMFGPVKASVMAFAKSMAQTLAPNVRVNTVAPGWIQTAWGSETSDYWNDRAKGQSLMNRWGQAKDVAAAVAFAANPHNDFLNGQCIEINGGWNRKFQGDGRAKK